MFHNNNSHASILPQYVLVNHSIFHVSSFANLPPKRRPTAICPACNRQVTLKLGKIRAHHFAHQPDVICKINSPETALHYNTKFYLAEQLKLTHQLKITVHCSHCSQKGELTWASDWNDVQVEYKIQSFRLDIALLKDGHIIAAIEVLVTNKTDQNKAQWLAEKGIRWIEVKGNPDIYQGDSAWKPNIPLSVVRCEPECKWVCPNCKAKKHTTKSITQSSQDIIRYGRMLDFYYPSGKKYRETLVIKVRHGSDGKVKSFRVCTWKNGIIKEVPAASDILEERIMETLSQAAEKWVEKQKKMKKAIVDQFMDWHDWRERPRPHPKNLDRYPFRYSWTDQRWQENKDCQSIEINHNKQYKYHASDYHQNEQQITFSPSNMVKQKKGSNNNNQEILFQATCISCEQKTQNYWHSWYDGKKIFVFVNARNASLQTKYRKDELQTPLVN